jgi:hypothetical protein
MNISSLKKICIKVLVEQIKNLPPMIQEEVVHISQQEIRAEVEQKITSAIYDNISKYLPFIIGKAFEQHKSHHWDPYNKPLNMDKRLMAICDEVSDMVIQIDNIYTCRQRYNNNRYEEDDYDMDENSTEIDYP